MKEWTTPESRNTPSAKNLEEEETVEPPGNDGNASMPEQVKRPAIDDAMEEDDDDDDVLIYGEGGSPHTGCFVPVPTSFLDSRV